MTRLALAVLVATGLGAALALDRRARREPGSRLPWVFMSVAVAVDALATLARALLTGASSGLTGSLPGAGHAHNWLMVTYAVRACAVPLFGVGLFLLPHVPPRQGRRIQRVVDAGVAALSFGIVWVQLTPEPLSQTFSASVLRVMSVIDAAFVATSVVYVITRARIRGGLPYQTLLALCGGAVLPIVGNQFTRPAAGLGSAGLAIGAGLGSLGYLLIVGGALRRVELGQERFTVVREALGTVAPLFPLALVGIVVMPPLLAGHPLAGQQARLGVLLLLALIGGSVLSRLENAEVVRLLEHRVAERTLDLGTRERWFRALVQNASDVVTVIDGDLVVRYQTPSALTMLGLDPGAVVGERFDKLLQTGDGVRLRAALADAERHPGTSHALDLTLEHADGYWLTTETTVTSLLHLPDVAGFVLTTRDVSERRRLEEQLTRQAYSDPLTGLANRAVFRNRVEQALGGANGEPASVGTVAVLFLDLDGFKGVNDAQGHAVGDELLGLVAQRLRNAVRAGDVVARLGGDEFGVLVVAHEVDGEAIWVADRVKRVLDSEFRLGQRQVLVGASVGIAINDEGHEDADLLLRNADLAMYRAKGDRRLPFVRFEAQMHDDLLERVTTEGDLRRAVRRGELELHYQPLVDLASQRVVGVEALLRWRHRTRGLIAPGDFVALAEETGLVGEIGSWALSEACRTAVRWQEWAAPGGVFAISVNVSAYQMGPLLPGLVTAALDASGLPARALTLEMTETVLMERTDEMVALLERFKVLGVGLAVDDFGTGYSSLSYLSRFPVDTLKIDRSFVESVGRSGERTELARTIVQLGAALELSTVAEGIELAHQAEALAAMGCTYGQGFYFAPPLTSDELDAYLALGEGYAVIDDPRDLDRTYAAS